VAIVGGHLELPKIAAVALAGAVVVGAAFTGSFRRFDYLQSIPPADVQAALQPGHEGLRRGQAPGAWVVSPDGAAAAAAA
jgi:hypothetical protein